jgi:plasmid stabilization system protein ParE
MYKVLILPVAQQDIREAALWYNEKKKGLGLRFSKNVRLNLKYIIKNPLLFANRYKTTHTAVMKDFPFMIHYQIQESTKIVVVTAVFHTSLNPSTNWKKRTF